MQCHYWSCVSVSLADPWKNELEDLWSSSGSAHHLCKFSWTPLDSGGRKTSAALDVALPARLMIMAAVGYARLLPASSQPPKNVVALETPHLSFFLPGSIQSTNLPPVPRSWLDFTGSPFFITTPAFGFPSWNQQKILSTTNNQRFQLKMIWKSLK